MSRRKKTRAQTETSEIQEVKHYEIEVDTESEEPVKGDFEPVEEKRQEPKRVEEKLNFDEACQYFKANKYMIIVARQRATQRDMLKKSCSVKEWSKIFLT